MKDRAMKDQAIRDIVIVVLLAIICLAVVVTAWVVWDLSWPGPGGADVVGITAQGLWADYHSFHDDAVANGNGTAMTVLGLPLVRVQVQGVTTATITFEVTVDGTNWDAVEAVDPSDGSKSTTTTADGQFWVPVGGAYQLRSPISGYSGGTIDIMGYGVSSAGLFSIADVSLAANSGVDIGDVDVLSIAAGENHAMEVGYSGDWITATLTISNATQYADNDVLAETQELAGAMRVNGGSGWITSLVILDEDDQGGDLTVYFLRSNVSLGLENDPISITDADARQIMCTVLVLSTDYDDLVNSQVATLSNIGCGVEAAAGATSIWVAVGSNDTKTYTGSGLQLAVYIEQN